ncbi:GreA/GreB family elongation factor [Mycobacterium sp. CPCC 205372]|uniref:GreA/GreB family elongation factor n=1 Tax=Mycobacterium hippophais TaxID=3016340 RepID=A0ABT4PNE6_9MYCO|nr:GreA/GreB family elongation factor [Mycobacterium hippophais]MCZ8378086.1 GreA/GreB family elongation factor [Mycobacterium hippophais]
MIVKHTVWLSPHAYEHLQDELATLRRLTTIRTGDADTDENATAVQAARRSRIQQIHDLLMNAVVGEDPPNDGIAEPGMVVTVRYDDTGEAETFLLGVRGAEYGDLDVYSVDSPLGAAIVRARPGQRCTYTTPNGETLTVTMLRAVPHGIHSLTG